MEKVVSLRLDAQTGGHCGQVVQRLDVALVQGVAINGDDRNGHVLQPFGLSPGGNDDVSAEIGG